MRARPGPVRVVLTAALSVLLLAGCDRPVGMEQVTGAMHRAVDSAGMPEGFTAAEWSLVQQAYRERDYRPLWTGMERPLERGTELLTAVCDAERYGLRSHEYDLADVERDLASAYHPDLPPDSLPRALARLDLTLTGVFLHFGRQLFGGRLSPRAVDSGWFIPATRTGVDSALALALRQGDFQAMVSIMEPRRHQYHELRKGLAQYRAYQAAGGWDTIPVRRRLKVTPGQDDSIIPLVRRRLSVTGELPDSAAIATLPFYYDSMLAGAVARFQELHGLETDSVIGASTIQMMNVPVEDRIAQIELNLERYRWIPDDLGPRYILVNIPDYQLHAYDQGKEVLTMRVVVGKDYDNPTPVFSDSMSYLVFRPYWNVPERILKEEIIPAVRKDSAYLHDNDYEVLRGRNVVDPASIDWARVDTAKINFRVRQRPGRLNSLGLVKFMFPNQFDVYLHDTPARSLFRRASRAASHGCIRVERPEQLAEYVLSPNADWDLKRIREAMQRDTTREVRLREKVPVYIVYFTSFVRDDAIRFRTDLYGTDRRAIALIRESATSEPGTRDRCHRIRRLAGVEPAS